MVGIIYQEHDGTRHVTELAVGATLMGGAKTNAVPGILADCGGVCACATCHVYIPAEWRDRVGPATDDEDAMLDLAYDRKPASRLSCQVIVSDALDGIVVLLPLRQNL